MNSLQVVCSPNCALNYTRDKAEKKQLAKKRKLEKLERAELRKAKEKLKGRRDYIKDADREFNKYIRVRDFDKPCISCGKPADTADQIKIGGGWDSGHYRSRGSNPELRYCELNAHKQCKKCNNQRSGNVVDYRINLIKRIGLEKVEWLEGKHEPLKLTVPTLKKIIKFCREKTRQLINERGI